MKGGGVIRFTLDEARSIRKIRRRTESWSPLADGQIIAQSTLRPIVCHGGYDLHGAKRAVVWANGGKLTGEFEIVDVTVNKQPPEEPPVVYTGRLRDAGFHIWGGNNYIADFSDFGREGLYCLRLKVKETREVADSYVFGIRRSLYLDLARKAARWFYYQRCGCEVPGWHGACHTEDALILEDGRRIDATGGWHDAGDYGKWVGSGAEGIWALATFAEEFGDEEALEEAAWEAEYLCKVYHDGVFHQIFTPLLENVCVWMGAPEKEPPRVVTVEQSSKYPPPPLPFRAFVGACLAKVGRLTKDGEVSERCLSVAREVRDLALRRDDEGLKGRETRLYLILQAGLLLSDLELYRVEPREDYIRDARRRVQEVLSLQDEEGFFWGDRDRSSEERKPFHLVGLYEFLRERSEDPICPEVRDAFRRWADRVLSLAQVSPFGQVGVKAEDGSLRNLGRYQNWRFGAYTWGLATASMLLGRHEYLEVAERQIQWILGLNPADISMMAGVGRGPGCYHHRYCFIEGHEDGVVPGGILNGLVGGTGGPMDIGDFRTGNFVVSDDLPVDYPIIDTDVWGWTYAYKTNEYWTLNNAWFIMGALQVEKAMKELKG